jgi:hypothetical protein
MTVHISDVEDVVEPLSPDFGWDDTTEDLQNLKADLEDDLETVGDLVGGLLDFIYGAQDRVREIEDVLDERGAAEDESKNPVQVETTAA